MIANLISKVFGTRSDREIKLLYPLVDKINSLSDKLIDKTDDDLKQRTLQLMEEVSQSRISSEKKAKKNMQLSDEVSFGIYQLKTWKT